MAPNYDPYGGGGLGLGGGGGGERREEKEVLDLEYRVDGCHQQQ